MIDLAFLFIHPQIPNAPATATVMTAMAARLQPDTDPENGNEPTGAYRWSQIPEPHRIWLHHVLPYQPLSPNQQPYAAVIPTTLALLPESRIVAYGPEDAARGWPRYINWTLRRGIDGGKMDAIVAIDDTTGLTANALRQALGVIRADPDTVLVERPWGRILTRRMRGAVRDLREDMNGAATLADLKARITERGLRYG